MTKILGSLLALLIFPSLAWSQSVCRPSTDSNEADLFGIFSVPLALSPLGVPTPKGPGTVAVTLEAAYLPNVDDETATPTQCRPGKGPENTDLLVGFPRPRVSVWLPADFMVEVSWLPPLRVSDVKANLVSFALARQFGLGAEGLFASVRAHGIVGEIKAPITCDEDALLDSGSECFQGTESDDRFEPNLFGADVTLGWELLEGRLRPYLGGGVSFLRPRFQVHFVNSAGILDDTKVEVDLERGTVFGGVSLTLNRRFAVTGEVFSNPRDAVTGRIGGTFFLLD